MRVTFGGSEIELSSTVPILLYFECLFDGPTVDSWCVFICTCAEEVKVNICSINYSPLSMLRHAPALQLDHVLVWWHSSILPISYGGPTSQPCRLVPTVRSSPRCPTCKVIDLSLPVPSARSPHRGPTYHLVWPRSIRWDRNAVYPLNLETCQIW